jgi:hypothetical protein
MNINRAESPRLPKLDALMICLEFAAQDPTLLQYQRELLRRFDVAPTHFVQIRKRARRLKFKLE